MKLVQDIRRLKELGYGKRKIATILGIHRNTVSRYLLDKESSIADNTTESLMPVGNATPVVAAESWTDVVDWQAIRTEALAGVPVSILYEENKDKIPVAYPGFWKQLQKRAPCLETTMVRIFSPGSRIEIDYCDGIYLMNKTTGEFYKTELFVGVLCSSRYTFAEFTLSQKSEDFLSSHVRMFDFFNGLAQVVSPDNLKSAVTKAHRYDPVINPAYTRLAEYYEFAVVPARVRTPRDKAIVERTIQIFQRWFFFKLRHRIFTSLVELNQCSREHLILFNLKKHRIFGKSRTEMFAIEKPHLIKLPQSPFQVSTYHKAKLSRDCYLTIGDCFYSAPHGLRGLDLDVWVTSNTVEIHHKLERVIKQKGGVQSETKTIKRSTNKYLRGVEKILH